MLVIWSYYWWFFVPGCFKVRPSMYKEEVSKNLLETTKLSKESFWIAGLRNEPVLMIEAVDFLLVAYKFQISALCFLCCLPNCLLLQTFIVTSNTQTCSFQNFRKFGTCAFVFVNFIKSLPTLSLDCWRVPWNPKKYLFSQERKRNDFPSTTIVQSSNLQCDTMNSAS